ncbi:MAG: phosphatidate cytidylyltransferase [Anaerolineae bacterium]|nr:phosphatidate cytidylyltransferase [Anaerolineae bacterium]
MTQGDIIGLITSYVYAFGLLFIVEATGKQLKWPQHFTRKIVHIGAGMWLWGILYFFDHWYFGIIPFATFIVLNYIFYRRTTFEQMDSEDSSPGTVYFAISITILFALFWRTEGQIDRVPLAAAAVMAMTWGDGMASIIGRKFGKSTYAVLKSTRTWEGSVAMFLFSLVSVFLTLWLLPASSMSPNSAAIGIGMAAIMALVASLVAALAEGVTPAGLDNLTVPLLSALALWLMSLL